jgi:anthranilate 1,2-dioxygenase large subunit
VFGSFSNHVPPLEEHLGEEIYSRIGRVMGGRTPVILGRYTQALPNNWKLYMKNVKDSYHASILHLFFTTFELNRLSQTGGIIVDPSGGHHVSFSAVDTTAEKNNEYAAQDLRSDSEFKLADPSLLQSFKEFPDTTTLQILSVFPTFVLQQIQNAIAVRQIVPRGIDRTDLHWTLLGFAEDIHRVSVKPSDEDELRHRFATMPAHPDVEQGLTQLKAAGFRLVAFTNSPPVHPSPVENAGLGNFFEREFSIDRVRRS